MQPTGICPGRCPRCGGELQFKANVGSLGQDSETYFFQCKECDHILRSMRTASMPIGTSCGAGSLDTGALDVRHRFEEPCRMPPSSAGGLRCSCHKARARRLGCIVSCVRITSKLSHSVFLGSNAKTNSCRHAHYRGRIVGRRPGAGLLFRPAPCVCVERAGNVFVPRRDSFVYRVVAIRVALVLRIIQNG